MTSEVRQLLGRLRGTRRRAFAALAAVPEERMSAQNLWRKRPVDVRFLFLRLSDHDEEHALQVQKTLAGFGFQQTEAQQILAAAVLTRGDLEGALVGLADADLDLTPAGEWPLRRTLAHIVEVERSYTHNTAHAVACFREERPWERPEPVAPEPEEGTLASFLERLDAAREAAIEVLAGLPDDVMAAPTAWSGYDVDVRFRLLRFAHHEREHTAHILKWRQQVGREPTEAQGLLALGWRARALVESQLVGVPNQLLDRRPENGDGTLREVLEHLQRTDGWLTKQITTAA